MGRPKALLPLSGKSFLWHGVRALLDGGCDPVLVVVGPGDVAGAREAERAGARVLTNADPGEGPITSLRLALAVLNASVRGLVYLPVDHPLVRAGTVRALLAAARSTRAPLVLPVHAAERGHPVVFDRALFPELADPTLAGGARTVTHRHLGEALLVEVDDPGVLTDIDTPDAYESVIAGRGHPGDVRR
jgi:CTP:molybdopterin cytidylyltransferase MocA